MVASVLPRAASGSAECWRSPPSPLWGVGVSLAGVGLAGGSLAAWAVVRAPRLSALRRCRLQPYDWSCRHRSSSAGSSWQGQPWESRPVRAPGQAVLHGSATALPSGPGDGSPRRSRSTRPASGGSGSCCRQRCSSHRVGDAGCAASRCLRAAGGPAIRWGPSSWCGERGAATVGRGAGPHDRSALARCEPGSRAHEGQQGETLRPGKGTYRPSLYGSA